MPVMDERGHHEPSNKAKPYDLELAIESIIHIIQDNRIILIVNTFHQTCVWLRCIHELYVAKCEEDGCTCVSQWVYRKVFNKTFNLLFGLRVSLIATKVFMF